MSSYNGNPSNVTTPLTATVAGVTSATPIVITTSAAHNFQTGDTVVVAFVEGNTAANGTWVITVLTTTTFSLNTSTWSSGAYTTGGTATDESLTPPITIFTDGASNSSYTAANINSRLEPIMDRTQFLQQQALVANANIAALTFPARNWHGVETYAGNGPYSMCWNGSTVGPAAQQWMWVQYNTTAFVGAGEVFIAYESGTGDAPVLNATGFTTTLGPTFGSTSEIAVNAANGDVWWTYLSSGVGATFQTWWAAGTALGTWVGATSTTVPHGSLQPAQIVVFNGVIIVAQPSGTAASANIWQSVKGNTTPTGLVTGLSATKWILRASPTLVIALPNQAAGSALSIYTSSNGTTWTTTNITSLFASTDIPSDVAWSPYFGLWLMSVQVTSGSTRFMTSPDGVTWSAVGATHTTGAVSSVGASGDFWVGTLAPSGGTTWNVVFSPDAINWYETRYFLNPASASLPPRIVWSPTQLAMYSENLSSVAPTGSSPFAAPPYRFSLEGGLGQAV